MDGCLSQRTNANTLPDSSRSGPTFDAAGGSRSSERIPWAHPQRTGASWGVITPFVATLRCLRTAILRRY